MPQGYKQFEYTDEALEQAHNLGVEPDKLAEMARFAAPLTHMAGNRRYEGFWLRIEKGVVKAVGVLEAKPKDEVKTASEEEPAPVKSNKLTLNPRQQKAAKERVERAIALHFGRKPPSK